MNKSSSHGGAQPSDFDRLLASRYNLDKGVVTLFRLIQDSVFRYRSEAIKTIAAGIIGLLFQICAIWMIISFIRALNRDVIFHIAFIRIDLKSIAYLPLWVSLLFVFMLLSSLLIYYSEHLQIELACKYEAFCSKRVYAAVAYKSGKRSENLFRNNEDIQTLLKIAGTDARTCGRVIRMLLKLVRPALTFSIALIVLVCIDFKLTVVVLIEIEISLIFQYKNNLKGGYFSHRMENHARGASLEKRHILEKALQTGSLDEVFFSEVQDSYRRGEIKKNLEGYKGRYQTLEEVSLINNTLLSVLFCTVAIILGIDVMVNNYRIENIVLYVMALRYCLNHLRSLLTITVRINQYYYSFARYLGFLKYLKGAI